MVRFMACAIFTALLVIPTAAAAADDPGWPREYPSDKGKVIVYQPQIVGWEGYAKLDLRMALAVQPKDAKEPTFGGLRLTTRTETDFGERSVLLQRLEIEKLKFPNVDRDAEKRLTAIVNDALPIGEPLVVALDRILANIELTEKQTREVKVNLDPPPIFHSKKPAILVMFMGDPTFKAVPGTNLLFATNTNWDLFLEQGTGRYYMLHGEGWLTTPDPLKGPWAAAKTLPADLSKLPKDDNWAEVALNVPGKTLTEVPAVFASNRPAELIVIEGEPEFRTISGTHLMYVTNTESDLFLHTMDGYFYLLVAGRWFRANREDAKWSAATNDLPEDFAKIPQTHPRGRVLASVPGTDDAIEAMIMASIPRKATVKRSEVKVTVVYEGEPEFVPVEKTTVYYAVNSPYSVFRVENRYYCCHQAVWFVAKSPNGPWVVCDEVPDVLYTIPATHPKHNVTYVYVYDSQPDVVVVGCTSGYSGAYVAATGLVMFGLGYWIGREHDDHWNYHHYHYHSHYYGYGCGAHYDHWRGTYSRSSRYFGPYGGAGRGAVYNPHTGAWARGGYAYGPRGSAYAREAYNPRTGTYAARAGASNPYGSWGRSVVTRGDDWARAGHRSNARGTVAGFETSSGARGVAGSGRRGSFSVVQDKHGDVYVGRDGNVYKRGSNNTWKRRSGDGWSRVDRASTADRTPRANNRTPRSTSRTPRSTSRSSRSSASRSNVQRQLNRDSSARRRGNSQARRYQSNRSRRSYGGSRSRGGGGRRGGGGGRRR